ncbi:MAG TPA: hypothetical protein VIK76_05130 [Pyrinomonadaceae bacterium]
MRTLRIVILSALRIGRADVHAVAVTLLPRDVVTVVPTVTIVAVAVVTIALIPIVAIAIPIALIPIVPIPIAPLCLNVRAGDCCESKNQEECQNLAAQFFTRVNRFH